MLDLIFDAITALGSAEAQNVLIAAGENAVKQYKSNHAWKQLLVETGEFFVANEKEESAFFDDLALVLSKDNMSQIASDLKAEDGFKLKTRLYNLLMQLMGKYEIPYEVAETYTMKIVYAVLGQLQVINPSIYEHYFLQEWRDEQEKNFQELQIRLEKMSTAITVYNRENIVIASSGQMDIDLRRSTCSPSIGIDFFVVDDENFQDKFEDDRYDELVFIRGRSREETIYCILNELWRLNDKRPIFIVKNMESWNKLQAMESSGNIYIPWFSADEIVAIENNTNIFAIDENTPVFNKSVLELRPRTRDTLSTCLRNSGMSYDEVYDLISDTHGLYSQIKKKIFKGEYLKAPAWVEAVSLNAKKTCLLLGCWEEIEGDKLIVETLYGDTYDKFIDEILPYSKGEDPLLYSIKRNGSVSYYLASTENIWSYLNISTSENIWEKFIAVVFEVINESENLFSYGNQERLLAQFNGEKLFWSETIRKGMIKTLLIKAAYPDDVSTQTYLDKVIEDILEYVKNEKQWIYISRFWKELCEISPVSVLKRLEKELEMDTGLIKLFQNQSSDFIFGRNSYIDILWGIEQFLSQKTYFWRAFRWLLNIDSRKFEYKSNSPKDIFSKIFCTWANFSAIETVDEKKTAAEISFSINNSNTWEYLYCAIDGKGRSIIGELSSPKYREHCETRSTTIQEMRQVQHCYLELLTRHIDFSVERWKKMIELSDDLSSELRAKLFEQLLYELSQMSDEEVMNVKNAIRHLIYKHRYFKSSEWAMSEENLVDYENLLEEIKIAVPEYEYCYLFVNTYDFPLLNPVPFDEEGKRDENELAKEKIIDEMLQDFKNKAYKLAILIKICAKESYSTLGRYLAKYWNNGEWDYDNFKELLANQSSGIMALDYLESFHQEAALDFGKLIQTLEQAECSVDILAKIYRIEAYRTTETPLVVDAPENIKREFWKTCIHCKKNNEGWVLQECKKYANLEVYLDQIHRIHYDSALSPECIFECLRDIEKMSHDSSNQMTSYHIEQLLGVVQEAFIDDQDKCNRIAHIEILFMNLLQWENMKCFHKVIKSEPELFAQLVAGVFKKDHPKDNEIPKDQTYVHNMYTIYNKAQFCPGENNGVVNEEALKKWVEEYRRILIENDQESLFSATLGRLFSFAPLSDDGHEPCEQVREMIEKYGDERMISSYRVAVFNRRGVYSPSAGKEEMRMAEEFKKNSEYLEPHYPKTAEIFYGLYENYMKEAERERMDAENGW